jgi:hypothetical protein
MFGNIGLTDFERRLMQKDFESNLNAHDAEDINICYQIYIAGTSDDIDLVYNVNKRPVDPEIHFFPVQAIHKVVNESDVDILSFGIFKVGDSIFYIDRDINLNEPVEDHFVVKDSLYILDANEVRWIPNIKSSDDMSQLLMLNIGSTKFCQPIVCKKFRTQD